MTRSVLFAVIPVGAVYRCGGSIWRKRSSRTTLLVSFGQGECRADAWFYESAAARCELLLPSV